MDSTISSREFTTEDARSIRKMTIDDAVIFLSQFPALTSEDRTRIISFANVHEIIAAPHHAVQLNLPRRYVMTTLWVLGGSYRRIGLLLGVTQQTVLVHVHKLLPTAQDRTEARIYLDTSYESTEWYLTQWNKHFADLCILPTPRRMAEWLLQHSPYPR